MTLCRQQYKRSLEVNFDYQIDLLLKDLVSDLQVDHTADFEDVRARLLDCVGKTSTQAGQQVLELRPVMSGPSLQHR